MSMVPSEAEWSSWFAGKEFAHSDYVTNKLASWAPVLAPLREREVQVLEIGSLEGRSALFFLNYLPRSRITCVDPFPMSREPVFDRNLAGFAGRLEKIKGYSFAALLRLRQAGRRFDLVYIDGDHHRETVLLDSVLVWPMLNLGGVLIWDDYVYKMKDAAGVRPAPAIDGFLVAYKGELEELHRGRQIIVRKTADSASRELPTVDPGLWRRWQGQVRRWRKSARRTLRRMGV